MSQARSYENWGEETRAIRLQSQASQNREHSVPIYMTSGFTFDSAEHARALFAEESEGQIYSRYSNPNTDEFIEKLIALEKAEDGIATSSGMSAMFTSIAGLLQSGDHVVASRSIFGSTHQILTRILPRWGISSTYVDVQSIDDWEKAVKPNTKMFFCETPSNPGLDMLDLEFLGQLAAQNQIILNVDNCFATPVVQNPMDYGADLVTHSATKFIDGQGRTLGGAILGKADLIAQLRFFARHTGPALSPFNAWVLSKGLETLFVRMEKHSSNAHKVALALEQQTKISRVRYPFLESHPQYELATRQMRMGGGIVTFELSGGLSAGKQFLDSLRLVSRSANLGDSRTIATHPASTTHSKLQHDERLAVGITDGLIRLSIGLESIQDILDDINQALERIQI